MVKLTISVVIKDTLDLRKFLETQDLTIFRIFTIIDHATYQWRNAFGANRPIYNLLSSALNLRTYIYILENLCILESHLSYWTRNIGGNWIVISFSRSGRKWTMYGMMFKNRRCGTCVVIFFVFRRWTHQRFCKKKQDIKYFWLAGITIKIKNNNFRWDFRTIIKTHIRFLLGGCLVIISL